MIDYPPSRRGRHAVISQAHGKGARQAAHIHQHAVDGCQDSQGVVLQYRAADDDRQCGVLHCRFNGDGHGLTPLQPANFSHVEAQGQHQHIERHGQGCHNTEGLFEQVPILDVELALLPLPERVDPSLEVLQLLEDDYQLIVSDRHPSAGKCSVSMSDLASYQWAGCGKHEFARSQLERTFVLEGIALPNLVFEANNLPALMLAAPRTSRVSVLNSRAVLPEYLPANVVMLPICSEHIRCPIGLVWRRGYLSSIALRAEALVQAAAMVA